MTSYSSIARAAQERQDAILAAAAEERRLRAFYATRQRPAPFHLGQLITRLPALLARQRQQPA